MSTIEILGAREGNLKNISLEIPKNKLVVFAGLAGSGKSTLLIDVLYNECRRQYLEAMLLCGIPRPKVDKIRGILPAIRISHARPGREPDTTVGAVTNVYTELPYVYEKLGIRACPNCGQTISAANSRRDKAGTDQGEMMYCPACGQQVERITRAHFCFDSAEGACPTCEGLGKIYEINKRKVVNEKLSLEDGAVLYWDRGYTDYQTAVIYAAFKHYGISIDPHTPVEKYTDIQKSILYNGVDIDSVRCAFPGIPAPKTVSLGKFEGVFPILWRTVMGKDRDAKGIDRYLDAVQCPQCGGERLAPSGRSVTVQDVRFPQLSFYSLEEAYRWAESVESSLPDKQRGEAGEFLLNLKAKLDRFMSAGLGYITLDRETSTLSAGELQRLYIASVLELDLSGIIYILDQPTIGLHPQDTAGLIGVLRKIRDAGNSVLVIEHDPEMIKAADYVVDLGPGSGKNGGTVVAAGTPKEMILEEGSVTAGYLMQSRYQPRKVVFRKGDGGAISIKNANKYNLKNLNIDIPTGCLTTVTGPSGAGKSTLVFEVLAKGDGGEHCTVDGLEQFSKVMVIEQPGSLEDNRMPVAVYAAAYREIQNIFASTDTARAAGLTAQHFSFDTPGGRCENCEGIGLVDEKLPCFGIAAVACPVCRGNRFKDEVLAVKFEGLSIRDVLHLPVAEAIQFFQKYNNLIRVLEPLQAAGLGYLELGQTLSTLSGGERQRLKLAKELIVGDLQESNLYLLEEPTVGLHQRDVEHFLWFLDNLVEVGNTVIVVEHNLQIIKNSDWVIDLGPGGGRKGGKLVFAGTPQELAEIEDSAIAKYLQ